MTMIGNTLLNQIVKQEGKIMPHDILNNLHIAVRKALRQDQTGSQSRDGMDISFLCIEKKTKTVHWAGANNPLIIVRDGIAEEVKADKYPIGGLQTEDKREFTLNTLESKPGDTFYVYTDGFQDQFGGDRGRKYMTKRWKEFLVGISTEKMEAQPELLNKEISDWIGTKYEQIDDILVCGYFIPKN
jgi:sigma-B regulation protein RsbU (phosphoserine phosphatase)